jgi:hypothetical protein
MDSPEVQIKRIADGWEIVRLKFLKECLISIGDCHFKRPGDEIGFPSSENCDSALAVIAAYQLWDGAQFLKDCPYLSSPDSFFGKLYEEVVPLPENRSRASSYFGLFDKAAEEPIRFAKEVVHYLTQSKTPYEAPFEESFHVMYLIPWFCGMSRIVVATVFGDQEAVHSIAAKINRAAERID